MKFTFQDSIRFRTLGFIIAILSITYLCMFEDKIGTIILITLSIFCDMQYKCPYCNKKFDIRLSPKKIQFCPSCGKKLY